MRRYEAIRTIVDSLGGDELIIAANGLISRELHALRDTPNNFYMLGSMGLASSIGLGLALTVPRRRVVVIDGDGNILMNLGSMATVSYLRPRNLLHVVLDNECYDSTGGQPSVTTRVDLREIAKAAGYICCEVPHTVGELENTIRRVLKLDGPSFILVKVERGGVDVPRVSHEPEQIKERLRRVVTR